MDDATGRIFRLVDLLQSRGRMTTADLAEHLRVSERTVRRDLVRLHELDVPVTVSPGRRGGVSVEPGALLAPLRFTDAELLALLLGVRAIGPTADAALAKAAGSALRRIESVMTPRARARAQALNEVLAAAPAPPEPSGASADSERILEMAEAIHACRRVRLRYASATGAETNRAIDPYGLVHIGNWYVAAHCHLRRDLRTFRLDRVRGFVLTDERFDPPEGFDAFATVASSIAQAPAVGTIVCRVRLTADLETASRSVPPAVVVLEPDGEGVLLSVRAYPDELERIALHLLRMPWPVEVLGPDDLRAALRRVGERALVWAGAPR
jgi:predicted DNA-binding transcriptional regulator YafY